MEGLHSTTSSVSSRHSRGPRNGLVTTEDAGINMNPGKFKFAKKNLDFWGFELKEESVEADNNQVKSIRYFPRPTELTSTHSWFGLIEQVAWAFLKTKVMEPFSHLLKPKSEGSKSWMKGSRTVKL